jgi:hypothetical protein
MDTRKMSPESLLKEYKDIYVVTPKNFIKICSVPGCATLYTRIISCIAFGIKTFTKKSNCEMPMVSAKSGKKLFPLLRPFPIEVPLKG